MLLGIYLFTMSQSKTCIFHHVLMFFEHKKEKHTCTFTCIMEQREPWWKLVDSLTVHYSCYFILYICIQLFHHWKFSTFTCVFVSDTQHSRAASKYVISCYPNPCLFPSFTAHNFPFQTSLPWQIGNQHFTFRTEQIFWFWLVSSFFFLFL